MNIFNRCLSSVESLIKYDQVSAFSQSMTSNWTPKQQKIAIIAAIAFMALAILSTIYITYSCYFSSDEDLSFTQGSAGPQSPIVTKKRDDDLNLKNPSAQDLFARMGKKNPFDDILKDDDEPVVPVTPKSYSPYVSPKDPYTNPYSYPKAPSPIFPKYVTPGVQSTPVVYTPGANPVAVDPLAGTPTPQPGQPQYDPVLSPLYTKEKELRKLSADLEDEKAMLAGLQASAGGNIYGFTDQEDNIKQLQKAHDQALLDYPKIFRDYLINRFNTYATGSKKDHQEIFERVVMMSGFMKRNSTNEAFVNEALREIDTFLTKVFFSSSTTSALQEEQKADLVVFHEFFAIVDEHYAIIEKNDPQLARSLKVKLANLPLADGSEYLPREHFKKIYLSENEQQQILIDRFTADENAAVDRLIAEIGWNSSALNSVDFKRLQKLADPQKKRLLPHNVQKLGNVISKVNPSSTAPQTYNPYGYLQSAVTQGPMTDLYRASKARRFLERQPSVPRWYHSTKIDYLESIVKSGEIQVQHKQAFNGAWVSTEREPGFSADQSGAVLIFSHDISEIDPDVYIGFEKGLEKKRWRGLQKPIPLRHTTKNDKPYLALISLGAKATKEDKEKFVALMKSKGIQQPFILSLDIVDYMQKTVAQLIGNPNLTENWWGKGDIKQMEKPLQG